jgi:hypothetical protein
MALRKVTWHKGIYLQNTDNLFDLAEFFSKLLAELRTSGITDTDAVTSHPLVRLVVAQMAYLAYGNFDCGTGNLWHRAYQLAEMELGVHPIFYRPLEPGEKESILAQWAEEERGT